MIDWETQALIAFSASASAFAFLASPLLAWAFCVRPAPRWMRTSRDMALAFAFVLVIELYLGGFLTTWWSTLIWWHVTFWAWLILWHNAKSSIGTHGDRCPAPPGRVGSGRMTSAATTTRVEAAAERVAVRAEQALDRTLMRTEAATERTLVRTEEAAERAVVALEDTSRAALRTEDAADRAVIRTEEAADRAVIASEDTRRSAKRTEVAADTVIERLNEQGPLDGH